MSQAHWFMRFLQRLGQVAGIAIVLGIVGFPVLHYHFIGTVPPWMGYVAVVAGFGFGAAVFTWRSGLRRTMDALGNMPRRRYVTLLLFLAFILHFAILRIVESIPSEGAPDVYGSWVFFKASAMYPPGDRFLMQAVHFILGHSSLADVLFVSVMVTFACWMVYRLGSIAFGEPVGRLAGVVLALFPSWLLYGNLEYDLVLGTLFLLLTFLLFRKPPGTHPYWHLALYGLVLGFTCLVKPIAVPLPLVILIIYLGSRLRFVEALKRTAVIALFMCLAILPWTVRNYIVLGHFVPISTNFGVVLHTANNPEADGREMMMKPLPGEKDEVEMNRRHIREAVKWIVGNPAQFLKLVGYRIAWAWGTDSSFVSSNLYDKVPGWLLNAIRGIVQIVYLALVLIWLIGLFVYRHDLLGSVLGLVLLMPIIYVWALHLVCQAHGQHHLPVIPFMIILGAAVLARRSGWPLEGARIGAALEERD